MAKAKALRDGDVLQCELIEKGLVSVASQKLLALSASSTHEQLERGASEPRVWVDQSHSDDGGGGARTRRKSDSEKDEHIRSDRDYWEEIEPRMSKQARMLDLTNEGQRIPAALMGSA